MSNHRVQAFYTQKAKFYQRFFVGFLQWEKVLETFFKANDYLHPDLKILDAGCGSGPVTKVLYRLARQNDFSNITFHGFDLTPAMLDLFRQWVTVEGAQDIHVQQADVLGLERQLPPDWKDYGLVVSSAMLEYIPKEMRRQALANLRGLLQKNGRLLLFVTKRNWITRWIGTKWWGTNLFDRDTLEAVLFEAGFKTAQFKPLPAGWDAFMLAVEALNGRQEDIDEARNDIE